MDSKESSAPSKDQIEIWTVVREYYRNNWDRFRCPRPMIDPSELPWLDMFSPIERAAWDDIRSGGYIFFPQIPVLQYFLDFANPYVRVGIELDGKEWHIDRKRDLVRDNYLLEQGWHIYRIPGRESVKTINIPSNETDTPYLQNQKYYLETVEGVLDAIMFFYLDRPSWDCAIEDKEHSSYDLMRTTLRIHRLSSFKIPYSLDHRLKQIIEGRVQPFYD